VTDPADATAAFEQHRSQLRAVAYRMLGSFADVDDVLQDAWLRYRSVDVATLDEPAAWLTTVVARLSLNRLRDRAARREVGFPDVVLDPAHALDPERAGLARDGLGVALLVVLDALRPEERVAFVLHDAFAVPFDLVAEVLGTTPAAARQLASRARKRVGDAPRPGRDAARERRVVDAFLAAAERGDFDALVAVLHPDAVLRSDGGEQRAGFTQVLRGARAIAGGATGFGALSRSARPVLVNGAAGVVAVPRDLPVSLMVFAVEDDRIVAIDVLADPARLRVLMPEGRPVPWADARS
jgi:RNA polymerase sigma factor (sigma-70 family)